jgi:2-octaprenylphenol hydroxylase
MKNSTDLVFDVLIVGGGMVGLALARSCVDFGLKIAVIESVLPDLSPARDSSDIRVSAINHATIQQFKAWGLWTDEHFPDRSWYRKMEIWDEHSEGKLSFYASEVGQESLGYILENRAIVRALWRSLESYPNVTFFCADEWDSLEFLEGEGSSDKKSRWEASLKSGQTIWGEVLVGADGSHSRVREFLGINSALVSYGQSGIVANVRSQFSHEKTAYQRFLGLGPLAFLPLGQHLGSIVWSTSDTEAQRLMALPPQEFNLALTAALGERLGSLHLISERASFPLRHHHAPCYVKKNAILVGDAAHGIHPLAGQGVNLGFHDVRVFTRVLQEAALKNRPLLSLGNLKKMERQAWFHNEVIRHSMTALNAIFLKGSEDKKACTKIRNLGMNLVDRLDIVKNLFSSIARG